MATFLGFHEMGKPITGEFAEESWNKYKSACANHNCQPQHVHFSTEQGRAFCVTEAESADDVRSAHEEANVPLADLVEVNNLD